VPFVERGAAAATSRSHKQCFADLLNRLVFRLADSFQVADGTFRLAGNADATAVPDELVGELNPFVLRDDFHQILLDLLGFLVCGELQAVGEALYVSVDNNAAGDSVSRSQHDVAGLPGHAG
jgi:hypothetical protein